MNNSSFIDEDKIVKRLLQALQNSEVVLPMEKYG